MNAPYDFQTAEKRLDPYHVISEELKREIEKEAEALQLLRSKGYRIIPPCK